MIVASSQAAQEWLSPQEVAVRLGVSLDTIYRMIGSGELVATRVGKRKWGINRRALEKRLEENSNKKDELGASS